MRLTLRTLLAYLDDVLDATRTKEIGKKIQESQFADTLVTRIKTVTRQRRLMAPDLEPSENHLDANVVAEYLDNTLDSEKISEVEKTCLDSDVQLAEVAASHQVLTLILGEPVDIPPATRERMYKIVPHAQSKKQTAQKNSELDFQEPFLEVTKSSAEFRIPSIPSKQAEENNRSDSTFDSELPEHLSSRTSSKSRLPKIIACVLALLFCVLLVADPDFRNSITSYISPDATNSDDSLIAQNEIDKEEDSNAQDNSNDEEEPTEPVLNSSEEPTSDSNTEETLEEPEANPSTEIVQSNTSAEQATPAPSPTPADSTEKMTTEPTEPTVSTDPSSEEALAAVTSPVVPIATKPAVSKEPKSAISNLPPARISYKNQSGVLIQFDEGKNDGAILPHRSLIHPEDAIISPIPFTSNFDIEKGKARLSVLPGTRLKISPPREIAKLGMKIHRGQVVLEAGPALSDASLLPFPLAIAVNEVEWRFEFMTDDTRLGIEIIPASPEEPLHLLGDDSYTGTLYVTHGSVRFADGKGRVVVIDANQKLSLTPADLRSAQAPINLLAANDELQNPLPQWISTEKARVPQANITARRNFEKFFTAEQTVSQSLSPQTKNRNPILASWAVDALGQVEDIHSVTRALVAADQPLEVIHAAKRNLRDWLTADPEKNDPLLQTQLEASLPAEDRIVITRLLWGMNSADASNPETSAQIVQWMSHELLAVRDMAFEIALKYSGKKLHYRPDAPRKQNKAMVLRWENYLEKNEGKLLTTPPNTEVFRKKSK